MRLLLQSKNGVVRPKKLSLSGKSGMPMSGLGSYFLEVSAHALLKGATKEKNRKSLAFLGYFSEAKMEDYD